MTPVLSSRERIAHQLAGNFPIKWIFTGDSITHGAHHTFGYRDYPEHFAERVRWEKGRGRDSIITTGVSGWRITHIAEDLEWNVLQYSPQTVSLNVGMNDCVAGAEGVAPFGAVYRQVLDLIRKETDAALILHTPNTILDTPQRLRANLALYSGEIRKIAKEYDTVLVDHERVWLDAERRQALMYWLSDEIHPNEYGHRAMAHTLLRELDLFDPESFVCRLLVP